MRENKRVIIYLLISIFLISLGVTLAYWIAQILGNGNPLTLNFGDVKVVFTDSEELTANDIVPGWTTSKTFTLTNEGTRSYKYNIIIKDLVNTLVSENGLQYKITSTNGYNMTDFKNMPKKEEATKEVLAYNVEIPGNTTQNYTIEFRYYDDPENDQSEDMGKTFGGSVFIEEGTIDQTYLSGKITSKYKKVLTRDNFDEVVGTETATEGTIYKTTESWETEDGSEVYYFSGNVSDNWVKFGKDSNNAELYWRIIRTNEDGSVRLLYAGTSPSTTEGYIKNGETSLFAYNEKYDNTMYVGYKYGSLGSLENNRTNENDSTIKKTIDKWYASGLLVKTDANGKSYDSYISKTAIYCNDRATPAYDTTATMMHYGVTNRLRNDNKPGRRPVYKCGYNTVDKYSPLETGAFTGETTIGMHTNASERDKFSGVNEKAKLTYPVALMTADEAAYAGGIYGVQNPFVYYYLNSTNGSVTGDKLWWMMSPSAFASGHAYVYYGIGSTSSGRFISIFTSETYTVRPVISLKSCASISGGNGKSDTPYKISIDEACASQVN